MTRAEMDKYEAMLAARMRRNVDDAEDAIEVEVDGDYVEVTEVPTTSERCYEESCTCPGYHRELDTDALAAFPEILAEIERAGADHAAWSAADRAQRRAESGYAQ